MSISVVNSSSTNRGTGATVIAAPSGCAAGDLLIATIGCQTRAPGTDPDGWTVIDSGNYGSEYFRILYHYFETGETSYTWATSGMYQGGAIVALNGAKSSDPIGNTSKNGASSGTTATCTGINVSDESMLLASMGVSWNSNTTFTTISGMEEEYDQNTTYTSVALDYLLYPTGGATGDKVSTISNTNSGWFGCLIEIKTAPAPKVFAGTAALVSHTR